MIIGCTGNFRKEEYYVILDKIHNILKNTDVELIVSSDYQKTQNKKESNTYNSLDFKQLIKKCDLIFAIGGDGTILSTIRRLEGIMKPVMGIHIGGLGFLSECTEYNLEESINFILNQKYNISHRMMLKVSIQPNNDKEQILWALNDIVVGHGLSSRMVQIMVKVSEHYLNTFDGDGVIISTPTGSTAYNLSAGGPIIFPSMDSITITPICPHSLSARPIVLQPEEIIKLSFPASHEGLDLTIDGQLVVAVDVKTKIQISKSQHSAELVCLPNNGYFKTLRTKMGWLGNVR